MNHFQLEKEEEVKCSHCKCIFIYYIGCSFEFPVSIDGYYIVYDDYGPRKPKAGERIYLCKNCILHHAPTSMCECSRDQTCVYCLERKKLSMQKVEAKQRSWEKISEHLSTINLLINEVEILYISEIKLQLKEIDPKLFSVFNFSCYNKYKIDSIDSSDRLVVVMTIIKKNLEIFEKKEKSSFDCQVEISNKSVKINHESKTKIITKKRKLNEAEENS